MVNKRNKKKQSIKLNNLESIQGLMQEVYNDSCTQINDVQRAINELTTSAECKDVDDHTKVAKEKTNAYKVKDSAIKVKLEVAKLLNDIVKHNGSLEDIEAARKVDGASPSLDDFSNLREYLEQRDKEE